MLVNYYLMSAQRYAHDLLKSAAKIRKKSHISKCIWENLSNFCCFQEKWQILRAKDKSNA